jgi:hypothetical protein
MRQIAKAVTQVPELEETLCADHGEVCECEYKNVIVYGVATDDNKLEYMEGFSKGMAKESGETECSFENFGDPAIEQDKSCFCQRWVQPGQSKLRLGKCYNFHTDANPEYYFKNENGEMLIEPQNFEDAIYKKDATFKVVTGNYGDYPEAISL